jgi:hypothetical protein
MPRATKTPRDRPIRRYFGILRNRSSENESSLSKAKRHDHVAGQEQRCARLRLDRDAHRAPPWRSPPLLPLLNEASEMARQENEMVRSRKVVPSPMSRRGFGTARVIPPRRVPLPPTKMRTWRNGSGPT